LRAGTERSALFCSATNEFNHLWKRADGSTTIYTNILDPQ